jgi:uncharacterized protein (DUF302 family)/uncharacterized membrane protein YidH (DUF202 family)
VNSTQHTDVRDHLAAERTFLAWIRTGIALMGFGFVVARFGLFLQQLRVVQGLASPLSHIISLWIGTALIAGGIFTNVLSARHHARFIRELNQGATSQSRPSTQVVVIALFLALVGLAMAIYLIVSQSSLPASFGKDQESDMTSAPRNGMISKSSKHSVDETVDRLKNILQSKGVTLFALIDHSGEAEKVGMKMPATKLLIFGNPKAGTPLMQASPSIAIDLPLKILVAEDSNGNVSVSYNSPEYLQQRHGLAPELLSNIAVVEALAVKAAE